MKLKCRINGIDYDIVQGVPFSEEYNETLDSGIIILDQVNKINNLLPFDDVYIWNADEEFNGYSNYDTTIEKPYFKTNNREILISGYIKYIFDNFIVIDQNLKASILYLPTLNSEPELVDVNFTLEYENNNFKLVANKSFPNLQIDSINLSSPTGEYYVGTITNNNVINIEIIEFYIERTTQNISLPSFYKHLLIDTFDEEIINFDEQLYKYRIQLFSETKKLETIPLPNISITQPLNIGLKKTVYDYIVDFVDMYNPVIKVVSDDVSKTWNYKKKYKVSTSLKNIYGKVYSPDFSLNKPSLRDVLTQLFLVKDMIPYVYNDVIYAMDITKRKEEFNVDLNCIYSIKSSMSSENYCDNLKRTYSNALSQENSARSVEYLGFRNKDNALLTIGNMRVETRFPIYKINKMYMCYYKKIIVDGGEDGKHEMMFLCKQDISKLVKLNSERNILSQDWDDFNNSSPLNVDDLSKYKLCTVGYSIGSNYIEGWGTKYSYPKGWWDVNKTYIENILTIMDNLYPFGIYQYGYISRKLKENETFYTSGNLFDDVIISPFSNDALTMKSMFFIIDYQAFYNGSIIHSKDNFRDDITINDNSTSSLTMLEQDGLFQKEKANRFGNEAIIIKARYNDLSQIQNLGSVFNYKKYNDVIIFHREFNIYDNCIETIYYGTKDYVLKNYYTSVYAKHRTYNLMSYEESITRSENKKMYILLSKNKSYYEYENSSFNFVNFNENKPLSVIMSFLKESPKPKTIDYFEYPDKIDYGYIEFNNKKYATDVNAFVSGYSLCFNMSMYDNVSSGIYIKTPEPDLNEGLTDVEDDYTGSVQDWLITVDDSQSGFVETMGFYMCHQDKNENNIYLDDVYKYDKNEIINVYNNRLFKLPLLADGIVTKNVIGNEYKINKDNKEKIDMTFQIEPITNDENIMFSQWIMKLSDLLSSYQKNYTNYETDDTSKYTISISTAFSTADYIFSSPNESSYRELYPMIIFFVPENETYKLQDNMPCNISYIWNNDVSIDVFGSNQYVEQLVGGFSIYYKIDIIKIIEVTPDYIILNAITETKVDKSGWGTGTNNYYNNVQNIKLQKINNIGSFSSPQGYYMFSNIYSYNDTDGNIKFEYFNMNYPYYIDSNGNKQIIRVCFDNKKRFNGLDQLSSNNADFITANLATTSTYKSKEYYKNMYIVESPTSLKKTIVYDEYKLDEITTSNLLVNEVFTLQKENDIEYIKVDLTNISSNTKSVQLWFLDKPNDLVNNEETTFEYFQSNDIRTTKLENSVKILEVKLNYNVDGQPIQEVLSDSLYNLQNDLLQVDLTSYNNNSYYVTVNYIKYYYVEQEGSLKFVFGVNLSEEDFEKNYVRINMSLISKKDTRVYDSNNNLVGEILNYVDENNDKFYGEDQYYCDIIK